MPCIGVSHLNDGLSLADRSWELPRAWLSLVDLSIRRLARGALCFKVKLACSMFRNYVLLERFVPFESGAALFWHNASNDDGEMYQLQSQCDRQRNIVSGLKLEERHPSFMMLKLKLSKEIAEKKGLQK